MNSTKHLPTAQYSRSTSPVFVVGCHRSGTNLLYDTLLSAGGFAVYRGYLPVYKTLIPKFGSFDSFKNRKNAIQAWLRSKGFRRSGLDESLLAAKLSEECRTGGDFMTIVMDEIARSQNAARWALYDPDNVLRMEKIKADIPSALFVHMIRDGRDIALSLKKMGGFQPLPWDRGSRSLPATGMYWEWMVHRGMSAGQRIPADYIEVHYEDLVVEPEKTLAKLGSFLDHNLDYSRIRQNSLGRLSESNSSFRGETQQSNPVNRWKERLTREEVRALEAVIGGSLEQAGYEPSLPENERKPNLGERWMRTVYPAYLDTKLWLKTSTPAGRLASLSELEIEDAPQETQPQAVA